MATTTDTALSYRYLVVAAGLQLDWAKIDGLTETLGKNGVTSNYSYASAPYTWECIRSLRDGDQDRHARPAESAEA
jgi:sulfide:quinone oxidoreductase